MDSKCKPKFLTLFKLLCQASTVERQHLTVLQAITEAFLQMTFMVPQETSYQGRGGQKGKSGVSQDSIQCFQMEQNWEELCWPCNISVEHTVCTYRLWTKISVKSQKSMQTGVCCWKDVALSDSEELCPQVVEGETYEENSAESAGFLVSGWKEERYFVLCRIDQNIHSPATSHQSSMACVSWLKKKMSRKRNSLPFRRIHSFSCYMVWIWRAPQKFHVLKLCFQ